MSPWWTRDERDVPTAATPKADKFALQRLASPRQASEAAPDAGDAGATGLQGWQEAILDYSESVPPLGAAARYYKNATLMCTFRVVDADGNTLTQYDGIMETLHANIEQLARGVELLFLIGDTRGLASEDGQAIEMLSPGELFKKAGQLTRVDDKGKPVKIDENARTSWRTYEPSVRDSNKAIASTKALRDVFEAYRIAYGEERALSIRSAMNAGVTLISDDVFGSAATGEHDSNATDGMDPADALETRFINMLGRTIRNPRDSAAFAPPVLSVPGSVNEKVMHVSMAEKRDTRMLERRLKALREEIAIGIDLPADIAAGFFADLNHWNVWAVDEAADKNYIRPKVGMVAKDAFHELADALGMDTAGATLEVDTSALVSQRDKSGFAIDAHAEGLISDQAARDSLGYDEDDAPDATDENATVANDTPDSGDTSASATEVRQMGAGVGSGHASKLGLKGTDAEHALDKINPAMKKARLKLDRQLQRDITALLNQLQSEAVKDDKKASVGGRGSTTMALGDSEPVRTIVANISARILKAYKEMSLGAARGLATKQAKEWYERTLSAHTAQADKAAAHALKVAKGVIKATATDATYPSGVARNISVSTESVGSGGNASMASDGSVNGTRPSIISQDTEWLALLNDEIDGPVEVQYEWSHGGSADPFPPHEELDGTTWFIADEQEVLDNPDSFPDSAIYYPGDHIGCTCEYDADMVVM